MSPPEAPNPERKSNNALLCFCIGAGLAGAAWLLGIGSAMSIAFMGANPALLVGGVIAAFGLILLGVSGFILMAVGAVWLFVRVLADQHESDRKDRYRHVER